MKINKLTHKNIKPYGWIIDSKFMKTIKYYLPKITI